MFVKLGIQNGLLHARALVEIGDENSCEIFIFPRTLVYILIRHLFVRVPVELNVRKFHVLKKSVGVHF